MLCPSIRDSGHIKSWETAGQKEIGFVVNILNIKLYGNVFAAIWADLSTNRFMFFLQNNSIQSGLVIFFYVAFHKIVQFVCVASTEHQHLDKEKKKRVGDALIEIFIKLEL